MGQRDRTRRRQAAPRPPWPALAVLALVLATGVVLVFNEQHSGHPLKVRREMRKF